MSHKPSHGYEDEPQEGDGEAGGENGDIGGLCADGEDDGDCVDDGIGGGDQENISPIET